METGGFKAQNVLGLTSWSTESSTGFWGRLERVGRPDWCPFELPESSRVR